MESNNLSPKICDKLKKLRLEAGQTQEDCAEELECTAQYLSLIENGHKIPSGKFITKIAELFGVNPGVLFESREYKPEEEHEVKSHALTKINRILSEESEDRLESLYKVIKVLIREF